MQGILWAVLIDHAFLELVEILVLSAIQVPVFKAAKEQYFLYGFLISMELGLGFGFLKVGECKGCWGWLVATLLRNQHPLLKLNISSIIMILISTAIPKQWPAPLPIPRPLRLQIHIIFWPLTERSSPWGTWSESFLVLLVEFDPRTLIFLILVL